MKIKQRFKYKFVHLKVFVCEMYNHITTSQYEIENLMNLIFLMEQVEFYFS